MMIGSKNNREALSLKEGSVKYYIIDHQNME